MTVSGQNPGLEAFMPTVTAGEEATAHAGAPLSPGTPVASPEQVVAALKTVYDPEIPVDIYELGLIYGQTIAADGNAEIAMTLTAPTCPVAGIIPQQVAEAVAAVDGIGEVEVKLVWEPPWTQERMSEEARLVLNMF